MKSRPRQAENRVAEILSDFFVKHGLSPVERIPILGREGPDITMNEARLVIDVKSRKECPAGMLKDVKEYLKAYSHTLAVFRLDSLDQALMDKSHFANLTKDSVMVTRWLDHMADWTESSTTGGIPAIVIHQPQLPYGQSALIMYQSDVGLLRERIANPNLIGSGEAWLSLGQGEITVINGLDEKTVKLTEDDYRKLRDWVNRAALEGEE